MWQYRKIGLLALLLAAVCVQARDSSSDSEEDSASKDSVDAAASKRRILVDIGPDGKELDNRYGLGLNLGLNGLDNLGGLIPSFRGNGGNKRYDGKNRDNEISTELGSDKGSNEDGDGHGGEYHSRGGGHGKDLKRLGLDLDAALDSLGDVLSALRRILNGDCGEEGSKGGSDDNKGDSVQPNFGANVGAG